LADYLRTSSFAEAGRLNGINDASNARKAVLRQEDQIERVLDELECDLKANLRALTDALVAGKPVGYIQKFVKDEETQELSKLPPGEYVGDDWIEYPDHQVRIRAAEVLLKARGAMTDKLKVEGEDDMETIVLRLITLYKLQGKSWRQIVAALKPAGITLPPKAPADFKDL